MARNRGIYQGHAFFVSATGNVAQPAAPVTGLQLHRMQTVSDDFNVARTNVNQLGNLAAIDRIITTPPTVTVNAGWLITNALNESRVGFNVDGATSMISGILANATDINNYYVLTAPEGSDAVGGDTAAGSNFVRGFGNGFITNYTAQGRVGGFPEASISIEALNWRSYVNSTGQAVPTINAVDGSDAVGTFSLPVSVSGLAGQSTALQQGDITLSLSGTLGVLVSDLKAQSFNFSVPLARTPQQKLGSKFPFSRTINFPIDATLSVDCEVGDFITGSLSTLICNDPAVNCAVTIRQPVCGGSGPIAIVYTLKQAKLDSENFSDSIGPNDTVSLRWSAPIGAKDDLTKGIFCSGIQT